jgi:hypothetical protein
MQFSWYSSIFDTEKFMWHTEAKKCPEVQIHILLSFFIIDV